MLWVMSTHNICFHGEIRKILCEYISSLALCINNGLLCTGRDDISMDFLMKITSYCFAALYLFGT